MNERRVFLCVAGVDQVCLERGQDTSESLGRGDRESAKDEGKR